MNCPVCLSGNTRTFYEARQVPVHSVVILRSANQAKAYPTGDIRLDYCTDCGFIFNREFDESLLSYGPGYDGSQSHSAHFRRFHERLAEELIELFALRNKAVVEIGCGKGEFLKLLTQRGVVRARGFDPAYVGPEWSDGVQILNRSYTGESLRSADLVICKMTLEHIADPRSLAKALGRGCSTNTSLFIQVPDAGRVLSEGAFWDIYYEHCSYFRPGCLRRLFSEAGFCVHDVYRRYGGQYLMLTATKTNEAFPIPAVDGDVWEFEDALAYKKRWLNQNVQGSVVLWGAGSKAVALAHMLGPSAVLAAVDVNPAKWGSFLPPHGLPVYAPDSLRELRPDRVLVMNPQYLDEIRESLSRLGVDCSLEALA